MNHAVLACGPTLENFIPFIVMGILVLGAAKLFMYFGFVQAFRYRVAAPIPMTPGQAWKIALIRAALGITVIGGTWLVLYLGSMEDRLATRIIWGVVAAERLSLWWALGLFLAKLRGRRLLGWVVSGTAIDLATEAALFYTGKFGLASPILGIGAILAFILVLYAVGRRASLLAHFTARPLCRECGYDLTGNLSGQCPECGTLIGTTVSA